MDTTPRTTRTSRILIVDDDDIFLHLISLALTEQGYTVRTARDGVQGLELVESFEPDLIYLDVQMPVMGGEGFLAAYLQKPAPRAPVIALTGAGNLSNVIEMGVDDFIAKPVTMDTLYAYTRRYLRASHATTDKTADSAANSTASSTADGVTDSAADAD